MYKQGRVLNVPNIPNNVRDLFDYARQLGYITLIDEKGTKDNPGVWQRQPSKLSYEEAFHIIEKNKPHWVIYFRNESYLSDSEKDYWEFAGCSISQNDYGDVFIFIRVLPEIAEEIFKKFELKYEEY
jgi:hypothetical protein